MKKYFLSIATITLIGVGIFLLGSHRLVQAPAAVTTTKYVSLGDSVAAGVGLSPDSDSSACGRTDQSYPFLVAQKLHLQLVDLSCSGATLSSGILGDQNVNKLMVAPQLDRLFKISKPSLISITIGANDAGWTEFIGKCYTGLCGTSDDLAKIASRLEVVTTNLRDTMTKISQHFDAIKPLVLVTGYYHVFPKTAQNCTDLNGIDPQEMSFISNQQDSITTAVKASFVGSKDARFVPIDFSGHELCSSDPWIQGLNDKQPYHPTAAGQAEIARLLEAEIAINK